MSSREGKQIQKMYREERGDGHETVYRFTEES